MEKTSPIPRGLHSITPQLIVKGALDAIAFYERAFGAEQVQCSMDPSGKKVWHGHIRIGDSAVFVNDEAPEMRAMAIPARLWLYLENVDAAFERAVKAGAKPLMQPMDMFWGDRWARVGDAFGIEWNFACRMKDLTPAELKKAQDDFVASLSGK